MPRWCLCITLPIFNDFFVTKFTKIPIFLRKHFFRNILNSHTFLNSSFLSNLPVSFWNLIHRLVGSKRKFYSARILRTIRHFDSSRFSALRSLYPLPLWLHSHPWLEARGQLRFLDPKCLLSSRSQSPQASGDRDEPEANSRVEDLESGTNAQRSWSRATTELVYWR